MADEEMLHDGLSMEEDEGEMAITQARARPARGCERRSG